MQSDNNTKMKKFWQNDDVWSNSHDIMIEKYQIQRR